MDSHRFKKKIILAVWALALLGTSSQSTAGCGGCDPIDTHDFGNPGKLLEEDASNQIPGFTAPTLQTVGVASNSSGACAIDLSLFPELPTHPISNEYFEGWTKR